ncbi:MAG: helix-turn-helix domain-containing protein [Flavobacteriales bacterium]|nr:helix-turn-helix domain-containing protein [Flavobacteriales bacterium]
METYEEFLETILFNMRKQREKHGMRQYQMAEKLGYEPALYNKVELGKKNLRLPTLFAFCKELDVPVCDMFLAKELEEQPLSSKLRRLMDMPEDERLAIERMMDMALERHEMLEKKKGGSATDNG